MTCCCWWEGGGEEGWWQCSGGVILLRAWVRNWIVARLLDLNKLVFELRRLEAQELSSMTKSISNFLPHLRNRVDHVKHSMKANHKRWLDQRFTATDALLPSTSDGRHSKSFCELTDKIKNLNQVQKQFFVHENPKNDIIPAYFSLFCDLDF